MPVLIQRNHSRRVKHRWLRLAVEHALLSEGVAPRKVEVSIALIDDEAMRVLNAEYRKIDAPTDVLSFSQEGAVDFPGAPRLLGDIVISIDTAARQAASAGRTIDEEVCQLAIHGALHLLGYDDATPEGFSEMVGKGESIWRSFEAVARGAAEASTEHRSSDEK